MVLGVNDLKSEVKYSPWGHLEAVLTSEAIRMAINLHKDIRVIEVTELSFELKSDLWGHSGDQRIKWLRESISQLVANITTQS